MMLAQNAQQVPLVDPAIVVVPTGLWLECDPIEQLASLDLAGIWENAHKIWGVSQPNRRVIEQLASTAQPIRLLAVHKHGGVLGGVVMGEWFVQGMDGNEFVAHPTPAPAKYLHNRLMNADGISAFTPNRGVRYSESMSALRTEQR
ncbi:hypothetical protein KGQ20_02685 [Catenulispora sp. NF23]|uniref:hypothetical protein n=1 Tax=Catenulispora pinistramenti TaxID=2705254 RepID=UPI001BAB5A14|nr:hypothetical protein [Catenulispora pinistramenti]MBS2531672.1 hypothetical protein [Catenulispora pinistramenti]